MEIKVICNGKARPFFGPLVELSYEAFVEMGKKKPGATVTYKMPSGQAGTLVAGQTAMCEDGTIVNVADTSNA